MTSSGEIPRPNQFAILVKHFFGRFLDLELISAPQTDPLQLVVQVVALLFLPGTLRSFYLLPKYSALYWGPIAVRDLATLTDKFFFLSLGMILIGFLTVFEWDALLPDRKDSLILTTLPIEASTIFFAKVTALLLFLLIFTVAINACPTLLFPAVVLAQRAHLLSAARYALSHAVSVASGCAFVFLSVITVRTLLLAVLPVKPARIISRGVQFLFLLLFLCALFSFSSITSVDSFLKESRPFIYFLPPMWFLGVYEALLGNHDPIFHDLEHVAFAALVFTSILSFLSYAVCYKRVLQRNLESAEGVRPAATCLRGLLNSILHRCLVRNPMERASFHFAAQTICRSRKHTLYLASFAGVGLSLVLLAFVTIKSGHAFTLSSQLNTALLSAPLVMSFVVLVGMRIVFTIPVDLHANWLFVLTLENGGSKSCSGVRKLMLCTVIVFLAGLTPLYLFLWDWRTVLLHISFCSLLSWILTEVLLLRFAKVPFACSYLPGKANIKLMWPVYVFAFTFYAYTMTTLEIWLMRESHRFGYLYIAALALIFGLIAYRTRLSKSGSTIRFDEQPSDTMSLLEL